jgi:hypothetical protein
MPQRSSDALVFAHGQCASHVGVNSTVNSRRPQRRPSTSSEGNRRRQSKHTLRHLRGQPDVSRPWRRTLGSRVRGVNQRAEHAADPGTQRAERERNVEAGALGAVSGRVAGHDAGDGPEARADQHAVPQTIRLLPRTRRLSSGISRHGNRRRRMDRCPYGAVFVTARSRKRYRYETFRHITLGSMSAVRADESVTGTSSLPV